MAGLSALTLVAQDKPSKPTKAPAATEGSRKLWGALVYAANDTTLPKGVEAKKPSKDLQKRLEKVFSKFSHFTLLGERSESLFKETYSWVAPSKEVCVKFDSKGLTDDGGIKLDLQLWSQEKAIIKTDAILKADSPVFIEGPKWNEGRLLFVIQLLQEQKSQ